MRIRTKLLITLLVITALPLLALGAIRVHTSLVLGRDLAKSQSATLLDKARSLMSIVAEDHARTLQRERQLIETALKFQVLAVRSRLQGPVPYDHVPVLFDTEIDRKSPPLPTEKSRPRCSWLGEATGKGDALECVNKQVFHLAPGLTRDKIAPDIARLAGMDNDYRNISEGLGDLIAWQLTSMENGLLSVYPGHGEFPVGYDARKSLWHQNALSSDTLVWSTPILDEPSGEILFSASLAVRGEAGETVAVGAVMAPLNVLLQQNKHTRHLSGSMDALFVKPEETATGQPHIKILAQNSPEVLIHSGHGDGGWKGLVQPQWLTQEDAVAEQLVLKCIQEGGAGVFQAPHRGIPSLWAIAPISGDTGVLVFIAPLEDILRDVHVATEYLAKRMEEQIVQALLILSVTILLVSGVSILVAKRFTVPLLHLSRAARRLSEGDFKAKVEIHGKDELAELGQIFNEMGPHLEENFRFREGAELAMQVQRNLLPHEAPDVADLDVAGTSVYCDDTGGDYYDFSFRGQPQRERSLAVALGDVSGHGMEAALLMTTARAFLRMRADMPGSPAEIVGAVNKFLSRDTEGTGRFMSLFYLEVELPKKSLTWVRAGHDPALLYEPATDEFIELGGEGLTLGIMQDWAFMEYSRSDFGAGQTVVLGSDGIWETRNIQGEMFGKERFKAVIREHSSRSASAIVEAVLDAVDRFRGETPVEDDVTLVVVKSV